MRIERLRALCALGITTALFTVALAQNSTQLVIWNFNEINPLDQNAMLSPDGGVYAGQASLSINLAQFTFNNNNTGFMGSPLDQATLNWGLQTTNYPRQGQNPGQAGIVVVVPTTNYEDIVIRFDVRWSNTAANTLRFQYTTNYNPNGNNTWFDGPTITTTQGNLWYSNLFNPPVLAEIDLKLLNEVDNKPGFAFRIVTDYPVGQNQYAAANPGSSYTPQGTIRYDLLEVLSIPRVELEDGDVTGDGCVDDADLLAVLFAFGAQQQEEPLPEDVNGDGVVDDADLLVILFNFGLGC